jgi:hypothetical protein
MEEKEAQKEQKKEDKKEQLVINKGKFKIKLIVLHRNK